MPLNGLPERDLAPGELRVVEHAHRMGSPQGALSMRCIGPAPMVFPAVRDDYRHQIAWAPAGSLALRRGSEVTWSGPQECAWIRRGSLVEVVSSEEQPVIVLLVRRAPEQVERFPAGVLQTSAAAREALQKFAQGGATEADGDDLLAAVWSGLGEVRPLGWASLTEDPVAHVVAALTADPSLCDELSDWARVTHVSPRTLARGFRRTYGMTWSQWRSQHRMQAARVLLETHSVSAVAHQVGYSSSSAFVQAFRREFGTTPGELRGV